MLAGAALPGYLVTGPENAHVYEREAALEGRPIDDRFLRELGLLSQLRYLTPGQVLLNSSMADPRILRVFGQVLTPYQSAGILSMLVTALALLALRGLYGRRKAG